MNQPRSPFQSNFEMVKAALDELGPGYDWRQEVSLWRVNEAVKAYFEGNGPLHANTKP